MPALLSSRRAAATLAGKRRRAARGADTEDWGYAPQYRYTRRRWHIVIGLIDAIGCWMFRACRALRNWRGESCSPRTAPLSILLVQLDHLGDAVMTTAVLPALRREHPSARIEVLASPSSAEIFRARSEVDCVWVCPRYRYSRDHGWFWPAAILYWGLHLRGRFDTAIDVRGELPLALLCWLTGATRRLGWNAGGGGFLLTDSPVYVPARPEVESRWALFGLLGISPAGPRERTPRTRPSREALERVMARLEGLRVFGQPFYVLHLGAGMEAKRWPARSWARLAARLQEAGPAAIVLVGGDDDRLAAAEVLKKVDARAVDWTGRTTLAELTALAELADVFVGADSGPAHLAAAAGVATVVLFSGTNQAEQWQPRGRHVRVVRHEVACSPCHCEECPLADHPCMTGLTVAQVHQAIVEVQSEIPAEMRCRVAA